MFYLFYIDDVALVNAVEVDARVLNETRVTGGKPLTLTIK
jgi:hypothetical protein